MYKNPFAATLRNAFLKTVVCLDSNPHNKNTIENILKNKRVTLFEKAFNRFLSNSSQKTISISPNVDESSLLFFAQNISGYLRDDEKTLDNLKDGFGRDKDLAKLYVASSKYCAEFSLDGLNSKYKFREHNKLYAWKVINPNNFDNALFSQDFKINPKRHNLIFSMPFQIKLEQEELKKWSKMYLQQSTSNEKVFGSEVDTYLVHFPISTSRGEKFSLVIDSISRSKDYFRKVDMDFIKDNLLHFLGENIKVDDKFKVTSGTPFSKEEFSDNMKSLTIFGYCSGSAHAHRWINALSHVANQLYDKDTVKNGLQNILILNYAFFPKDCSNTKYSNISFMSNYPDDKNRKEPFIKMFSPSEYEKNKYREGDGIAKVISSEDNKHHVVAFPLAEEFLVLDENGNKTPFQYVENGHNVSLITRPNLDSSKNYTYKAFKNIFEKASLGHRDDKICNYLNLIRNSKYSVR